MDHLAAQYYIVKEVKELNEFNERAIRAEGRSPDRVREGIRATLGRGSSGRTTSLLNYHPSQRGL